MTKEKFFEALEILTISDNRASKIEVASHNNEFEITAYSLTPVIIKELQSKGYYLNMEDGKMFIRYY